MLLTLKISLCLSLVLAHSCPSQIQASTNRLETWGPGLDLLEPGVPSGHSPSHPQATLRQHMATHSPLCLTYLLEGSFWRHSESNFLKDLPYFFIISLSSTPVSKVGGSFCKVSINTCSRDKWEDTISGQALLATRVFVFLFYQSLKDPPPVGTN